MSEVWQHIVKAIEPRYDTLKQSMEQGPQIKPILYLNSTNKWRITFEEIWPPEVINKLSSGELDRQVNWAVETLQDRKGVRRVAWDSWDFPSKREAEKFLIFYGLTWCQ